jgi:glycosyltransferase involved in cell wall biosynthesis
MRIGFVATHLGGLDGMSLQMANWADVLGRLGYDVVCCASELDPFGPPGMLVPEMHANHPVNRSAQRLAFGGTDLVPETQHEIQQRARGLKIKLEAFVEDFGPALLVIPDVLSVPVNVPLAVALNEVLTETGIPAIARHHSFYWQYDRYLAHRIPEILRRSFPLVLPTVRHVVTSTVMQRELQVRHGIEAITIPHVYEFETPPPPADDFGRGFRADLGLGPDDVVILLPAHPLIPKSADRVIDLVQMLGQRRRFRLVVTGAPGEDPDDGYFEWLLDRAVSGGIDAHFIGDRIGRERRDGPERIYTLWDAYRQADLAACLSYDASTGGLCAAALYYRLPLIVNRHACYRADIAPAGVQAIEFDEYMTARTAVDVLDLLEDRDRREAMVTENYQVGLTNFSFATLERGLTQVLAEFGD